MKTKIHGTDIVEILDTGIIINEVDDIFSLFSNNCSAVILKKENIADAFFDLSTGLAGAILQKFSNYRKKLAIIGDFTGINSKSLNDFIFESNKTKQILFVSTTEEAVKTWHE
jgi:hypothetical protein